MTLEAPKLPGLPPAAQGLVPLTRLETAFWVLDRLSPGSGVSNIELAFRVARPLRWWPLHTAANLLVRRHPALRLRFPEVEDVPVRHLSSADDAGIDVRVHAVCADELIPELQRFAREPFDLGCDLPLRVGSFTTPDGESVLCLVLHHIAGDVVSCRLLVEELCQVYDAVAGPGEVPVELRAEIPMLEVREPSRQAMRYWLDRLTGVDADGMRLATGRPAVDQRSFSGRTYRRWLSARARAALSELTGRLRVTDNILLLSAFNLALLKHGAGPDLVVGVPVGRRTPAERGQVGLGISTMAIRVEADPGAGFDRLVHLTRDAFLEGVEHAEASVEVVLTELGQRSADWSIPIFRHMFNYRPWDVDHVTLAGEPVEFIGLDDRSRLDMELAAVPSRNGVLLRATYATGAYHEADVAAFLERMELLLIQAAENAERPVSGLDPRTPADRALLDQVNATDRSWDGTPTAPERIAEHARARSAAEALTDGQGTLSYGQLTHWAEAVRRELASQGVQRGDVVGLAMGRGMAMVAAILGVWAAGAGFLPLDLRLPRARLAFQIRDAQVALVLADDLSHVEEWGHNCAVAGVPRQPGNRRVASGAYRPDDVAYVMYTSGSSGVPKGVPISHRNLLNIVLDFADRLEVDQNVSCLWSTTPAFDISMLELLMPLCAGARTVIADEAAQIDARRFLDLVERFDVDVVQATPTAWRLITEVAGPELRGRKVLCGGEPMPAALARELAALGARTFNVYGPTETTIWSTAIDLSTGLPPADQVPIGWPIANTRVFVIGPDGRELPPGLVGELCVAGVGVSLGYLGRAELTAERFGDHPHWGRFYRTGDLARLRPDGALEMFGRADRQVKLRGHRVELGEIESVLEEHRGVRSAVVVADGDLQGEDGRLLAFVRAGSEPASKLIPELWEHLMARLPHYAMPAVLQPVDSVPATSNGKVDHAALVGLVVEPSADEAGPETGLVSDELTAELVGLWRETLGRPKLTATADFFLNGGHSLLAVRLVPHIEKFAGRRLSPRVIFDHASPRRLAAWLAATEQE